MAEGPQVELHLLGKVDVRKTGSQVWIQGLQNMSPHSPQQQKPSLASARGPWPHPRNLGLFFRLPDVL